MLVEISSPLVEYPLNEGKELDLNTGNTLAEAPPVTYGTMFYYGFGRAADAIKSRVFETFLFFYYVQVLEVPGSYAGIAVGVALAFDAVSDPLMGSYSDRFKSRWGRRHPFMFLSVFPLTVTFLCLMIPPELSHALLAVWLCVFAVLVRASMTLFQVPHLSLGPELVQGYDMRTTLVLIRNIMAIIGSAIAFFVGFSYFFAASEQFENGQLNHDAYPPYALTMVVLMVISIFITLLGTRKHIPFLKDPTSERDFHLSDIFRDLTDALRNDSFRRIFLGMLFFSVYMGVHSTMNLHVGTYFWELTPREFTIYALTVMTGAFMGLPLAWLATRFLDKKWAYLCLIGASTTLITAPVALRLLGWFPENDSPLFFPVYLGMTLVGIAAALGGATASSSMVMDTTDEHEALTGQRQEGAFYGAISLSGKAASALGHVIGGFAIDIINFPLGSDVKPGTVDPEIIWQLGFVYGPLVVLLPAATIWLVSTYSITRERHVEIMSKIQSRSVSSSS